MKRPSIKKATTNRYPFHLLAVAGDFFFVKDMAFENSVRAQASKNQVKRGVKYAVSRVKSGERLPDKTLARCDGLIVRLIAIG